MNATHNISHADAPDTPHGERPISTESRGLRQHATLLSPGRQRRAPTASPRRAHYDALVAELKNRYRISIRKWRRHMSGVAYELKFRDGRIKRLISAPRPRGPVSAAIFLHEVGHHAVGFKRYTPRVLEEYYVWQWTLREMTVRGIPVDHRVLRQYRRSMFHYVRAAQRQGLSPLPHEVHAFLHWPG